MWQTLLAECHMFINECMICRARKCIDAWMSADNVCICVSVRTSAPHHCSLPVCRALCWQLNHFNKFNVNMLSIYVTIQSKLATIIIYYRFTWFIRINLIIFIELFLTHLSPVEWSLIFLSLHSSFYMLIFINVCYCCCCCCFLLLINWSVSTVSRLQPWSDFDMFTHL